MYNYIIYIIHTHIYINVYERVDEDTKRKKRESSHNFYANFFIFAFVKCHALRSSLDLMIISIAKIAREKARVRSSFQPNRLTSGEICLLVALTRILPLVIQNSYPPLIPRLPPVLNSSGGKRARHFTSRYHSYHWWWLLLAWRTRA